MATAEEKCACGAFIHLEMPEAYISYRLNEWRKGHRHWPVETKTVGEVSVSREIVSDSP